MSVYNIVCKCNVILWEAIAARNESQANLFFSNLPIFFYIKKSKTCIKSFSINANRFRILSIVCIILPLHAIIILMYISMQSILLYLIYGRCVYVKWHSINLPMCICKQWSSLLWKKILCLFGWKRGDIFIEAKIRKKEVEK